MDDYISRADAIEELQNCIGLIQQDGQDYLDERDIPLLNTAIDALKALPSADTEIKRVLQGYNKGANTIQTIRHEELTQIANTRKAVESADAVQGEWIVREYCTNELDYRRWIEIECPFCGEKPTYEDLDNMNYCPNCGARMKGGAE